MSNAQIALILRQEADRLQMEGANRYRIQAYRRAAAHVERFRSPISEIALRPSGFRLPGIGRKLGARILGLIQTGRLDEPQELESRSVPEADPPGPIPGVNPRVMKLLHIRYGIETREDLEKLARSRLLRTLPDIGIQLERSILKGLKTRRKG